MENLLPVEDTEEASHGALHPHPTHRHDHKPAVSQRSPHQPGPSPSGWLHILPRLPMTARASRTSLAWCPRAALPPLSSSSLLSHQVVHVPPLSSPPPSPQTQLPSPASGLCKPLSPLLPPAWPTPRRSKVPLGIPWSVKPFLAPQGLASSSEPRNAWADLCLGT